MPDPWTTSFLVGMGSPCPLEKLMEMTASCTYSLAQGQEDGGPGRCV